MIDQPEGPDPFAHPTPSEFDYRPLLLALRECRMRAREFLGKLGSRNPAHIEAEALIAHIDAVARLTRVPGASKFIKLKAKEPGDKWPADKPPDTGSSSG